MATTDELLAEAEASADEESTGYDYLTISVADRTISIPSSVVLLGVESDDEVQRLYFKMPATYGEFDLSEFGVRINYLNANNVGDVYVVDDATSDGTNITFSWLVGRIATAYKGNTSFIVCLKYTDDDGNVEKEFNTTVATLPVLEGLETTEAVISENADVIEQLLKMIAAIDPDAVSGGVTYSDGVGIKSMDQTTTTTTSGGANVWTATLTDGSTYSFTVYNGAQGETGVGIKSIAQTTSSATSGGANVWTATLTDGSTYSFTVYNGAAGSSASISVTPILEEGTAIAEINGTTIYAPSYTDGDEVSY